MDLDFGPFLALFEEYHNGQTGNREPVVRYLPPSELARELDLSLPRKGRSSEFLLEQTRRLLHHSVRTGHPRFFNQLFGGQQAGALLGDWTASLANTSMYTFESAPVMTLVERKLIERMCELVGFEEGEGVLAPGGSLSNLTAVLAARHQAFPEVKHQGLGPATRPVMFASEESHYSLRRAASVAGLGTQGCREIPVDPVGRMVPAKLEQAIQEARDEGCHPFLVAATSGTTVAGAFDPLEELSDIARRHGLWLHVDASYGGTLLFSERRRPLLAGIERADSVAWNPHKMMGVPLSCAATLTRERGVLRATLGMGADYLFHGDDGAWDLGDLSLQCGRRVDALKLWFAWQLAGDEGFAQRVEELFALAEALAGRLRERPGFHLVRPPQGTNVCFRYLPAEHRQAPWEERARLEHAITLRARTRLAQRGRFLINYATLDGAATFRFVASNPETSTADLDALLDEIEACAGESASRSQARQKDRSQTS